MFIIFNMDRRENIKLAAEVVEQLLAFMTSLFSKNCVLQYVEFSSYICLKVESKVAGTKILIK